MEDAAVRSRGFRRGARTAIAVLAAVLLLAPACARPAPPLHQVARPKPLSPVKRDPANGASWVIVYSPHPDDESIAMGQAIRRYVNAGYNVQAVLLTDGEGSRSFQDFYRRHPDLWRDLDRDGVKGDRGDFGLERRREFTRAVNSLGVPIWHISFYGAAAGASDGLTADFMPLDRVRRVIRSFEKAHPGALHLTVAKYTDGRPAGPGDAMPQAEHRAACEALVSLAATDRLRADFYKVYVYDLPASARWSPAIEEDAADHDVKRRALLEGYDSVDEPDHLGIGWHSVPVLIDNVLSDTREFRVPAASLR